MPISRLGFLDCLYDYGSFNVFGTQRFHTLVDLIRYEMIYTICQN